MSKRCPSGNGVAYHARPRHAIMHSVMVCAVAAMAAAAALRCIILYTPFRSMLALAISKCFFAIRFSICYFAISIFRVRLVGCTTVGSATSTHRHKNGLVFRVYSLLQSFSCVRMNEYSTAGWLAHSVAAGHRRIYRICVDGDSVLVVCQRAGRYSFHSLPTTCIRNGYTIYLNLVYYLFRVVNSTPIHTNHRRVNFNFMFYSLLPTKMNFTVSSSGDHIKTIMNL